LPVVRAWPAVTSIAVSAATITEYPSGTSAVVEVIVICLRYAYAGSHQSPGGVIAASGSI
jgi:hypothetical protein